MTQIHTLQHVPFEDPGYILEWIENKGLTTSQTLLYEQDELPAIDQFDWLIVMGGPMSIHDEAKYPWLKAEKRFIKAAIEAHKTVLGICLGAQLIAEALGAEVIPNSHQEIGWFPVNRDIAETDQEPLTFIRDQQTVFHWHGETFTIPKEATRIASSEACQNQGFIYNGRVVALQFHLEMTPGNVSTITRECGHEIIPGQFTQSPEEILAESRHFQVNNEMMCDLLDYLSTRKC